MLHGKLEAPIGSSREPRRMLYRRFRGRLRRKFPRRFRRRFRKSFRGKAFLETTFVSVPLLRSRAKRHPLSQVSIAIADLLLQREQQHRIDNHHDDDDGENSRSLRVIALRLIKTSSPSHRSSMAGIPQRVASSSLSRNVIDRIVSCQRHEFQQQPPAVHQSERHQSSKFQSVRVKLLRRDSYGGRDRKALTGAHESLGNDGRTFGRSSRKRRFLPRSRRGPNRGSERSIDGRVAKFRNILTRATNHLGVSEQRSFG